MKETKQREVIYFMHFILHIRYGKFIYLPIYIYIYSTSIIYHKFSKGIGRNGIRDEIIVWEIVDFGDRVNEFITRIKGEREAKTTLTPISKMREREILDFCEHMPSIAAQYTYID